jgi:hypothetical protein
MGEHILEHDRKSSKSEGLTPAAPFRERGMKALHKRCAGLDGHKVEVVACLRLVSKRKVEREVRRFRTATQGLLELREWLERGGCTHVAMEATGVYWKPVWHILEGRFADATFGRWFCVPADASAPGSAKQPAGSVISTCCTRLALTSMSTIRSGVCSQQNR